MPLTHLQQEVLAVLARSRGSDGYLAVGTALNLAPTSRRFSDDIDFSHDSIVAVAESFARDSTVLDEAGHRLEILLSQPGLIRALISTDDQSTPMGMSFLSAQWCGRPSGRIRGSLRPRFSSN